MKPIILAMTGASGSRYGRRLLQVLSQQGIAVELVLSPGAEAVLKAEEGLSWNPGDPGALVADLGDGKLGDGAVTVHGADQIGASIASGSALVEAMVVLPCSMASLAALASGAGRHLVHRAADVTLKEGRPLVVCPRETPLSTIHLRNMLRLSEAGACLLPCMPPFTHRPASIDELVDGLVMRVCDQLGLNLDLRPRWAG